MSVRKRLPSVMETTGRLARINCEYYATVEHQTPQISFLHVQIHQHGGQAKSSRGNDTYFMAQYALAVVNICRLAYVLNRLKASDWRECEIITF